jgi:hypothetical protein
MVHLHSSAPSLGTASTPQCPTPWGETLILLVLIAGHAPVKYYIEDDGGPRAEAVEGLQLLLELLLLPLELVDFLLQCAKLLLCAVCPCYV